MAISDRLNKLTTDITNAYTSIENKGGTIPANKNTNNLPTAINSIEIIEQATAEGESLSLANTKAMPYSDYVVKGKSTQEGEPSPSNPSEIHSVADEGTVTIKQRGKNFFDYNSYTYDKTILNAYRFIEIKDSKPNTVYVISNYQNLVNSGFSDVYMARDTKYSSIIFANLVGNNNVPINTDETGKLYLCVYASSWTEELWNTFISYFENAQLEERKNTNFI